MKDLDKFQKWLRNRGAVVLDPTNQWEVLRFRTGWGVSIIYKNKNGLRTFTGESKKAYAAFQGEGKWKAVDRKRQSLRAKKARLAARDGKKCFFHGERMGFDQLTIEHLLAVSHGGTDHEDNLCLTCEPCNKAVANKPITQKMLFRDKMLQRVSITLVPSKVGL
jgi:hypothetical protein